MQVFNKEQHSAVFRSQTMWNTKANGCVPPSGTCTFTVSMILLGQHNSNVIVFTFVAFFHVWTQPHIVRTGTRVLGRMGRDLRCRKTQIFTASIWLGAELTGIGSYSKMEEKRNYFPNCSFIVLGKET